VVYGLILAGQILAFLSGAALAQALAWRVLRVELGIHAVGFFVVAIIMLPSHRVPEAIAITCAGAVFGLVANAIVPRLWAGPAGDLIRKLMNALGPDEAEILAAAANADTISEWSLTRVERAFVLLPRFPASPITTIPAWYSIPLVVAFKRLGYGADAAPELRDEVARRLAEDATWLVKLEMEEAYGFADEPDPAHESELAEVLAAMPRNVAGFARLWLAAFEPIDLVYLSDAKLIGVILMQFWANRTMTLGAAFGAIDDKQFEELSGHFAAFFALCHERLPSLLQRAR
jgi:hypothetical protein